MPGHRLCCGRLMQKIRDAYGQMQGCLRTARLSSMQSLLRVLNSNLRCIELYTSVLARCHHCHHHQWCSLCTHLHGDGSLPFLQSFRAASCGLQQQLTRLPNRITERTPNFLRGKKQLLNILFKSFVDADLRSLHVQATKSVTRRARLNACRCVQLVFGLAWYYAMLCNIVCASPTR